MARYDFRFVVDVLTTLKFNKNSTMRLTDLLKPANIKVPIAATAKTEAIRELVELLAQNGELVDSARVLEAVLDREATRTTGIGYGMAIPHGKTAGTDHLTMAIGKCATPVDFASIDGRPVTIIWLLTSPPDKTGQHLTTLAKISKLMAQDRFRAELNKATTAEAVYETIAAQEVDL